MKKRLLSLLVVVIIAALMISVALLNIPMKEKIVGADEEVKAEVTYDNESIYLWYSDETLTNYINAAAVTYNEEHGTRIVPELKSPTDYLETINKTINEYSRPDMFIISNDSLGKVYLAGLGDEITLDQMTFESSYLSQAKNAMSYKDKLLGYPLNYETTVFLYNKTYLRDMAITALQREAASNGLGDESDSNVSTNDTSDSQSQDGNSGGESEETLPFTEDEINERIQYMVPGSIEAIKQIADNFDAPENVEGFFKWDVNDIFYNYFFIGDAINVGGNAGWDKNQIDLYTENAINAMTAYQSLNNFFSINADETDYDQVITEFMEGKTVFTIATSDVVARLENAKLDGTFEYDYGMTMVPSMSDELDTRSMSETNAIVISPYAAEHKAIANDFAYFMTHDYANELYPKAEKLSAANNVEYPYEYLNVFNLEYEYSVPLPKMLETSNFWIDLERTFLEVWNGEDVNEELKSLAEQILLQINGEKVELPYIEIENDAEEVEYLDEEAYRKEALEE